MPTQECKYHFDKLKIQISFNYYESFLHFLLCTIKIIFSFISN